MITFRDMTFCPYGALCNVSEGCHRVLTDEIRKEAEQWGLPIAQYSARPQCFESLVPDRRVVVEEGFVPNRVKLRRLKEKYNTAARCRDDLIRQKVEHRQLSEYMSELSWEMRKIRSELYQPCVKRR